jgi:hypothetical protein
MTSFITALWFTAGALAMGGFTIVLARRAAEQGAVVRKRV